MIIKKESSNEKTFYVSCANWECVTESTSHEDGATSAIEEACVSIGPEMEIAPKILSINLTLLSENLDVDKSLKMHDTVRILSNAGKHETARKFKKLIDLL